MADDRLPVMLQFLRVSIDVSGELTVDEAAPGVAIATHDPHSIVRDSRGRTFLLFTHENARPSRAVRSTARKIWLRNAMIALLWALTVTVAVLAAARLQNPSLPF
jgi:hypothetical protein